MRNRTLIAMSAFALIGAALLAGPTSTNATTLTGVHEYSVIPSGLPVASAWCQGNLRHFVLSGGARVERPAISFSMADGQSIILVAKDGSGTGIKVICRQGTIFWSTGKLPPPPPA